jgi:hypothetical protein
MYREWLQSPAMQPGPPFTLTHLPFQVCPRAEADELNAADASTARQKKIT